MTRTIPAVFGSVFYEEMPLSTFTDGMWQPMQWQASDQLTLHPGAHVFHYGSTCFEGLKAFRHANDALAIFRLDKHIKRMQQSAKLLHLPVPDAQLLRTMIIELTKRSAESIPDYPGALYLRPTLIGTDPVIGKAAAPSDDAILFVLASPVGDYFVQGAQMRVLIEMTNQRCAPHMGAVKSGGNYASALHWQIEAKEQYNAQQVLFCPNGLIQETGASNFILIKDNTIITRELSNEFLHGVTRDSILIMAKDLGYHIEERSLSVDELREIIATGGEAALTGTAAVISPVTSFILDGEELQVSSQSKGIALRQAMTDIQYGNSDDKHQWLTFV